jgi:hypothetical protein
VERHHARRALEAPWRVRVARVAVPSLIAGLVTTGVVAVAAGSATDSTSAPSVATTVESSAVSASPENVTREQGTSRSGSDRPALSPTAAAAAKAKAKKATAATKAKPKPKTAAKPALLPEVDLPSLKVVDTEYTRVALNVREKAAAGSDLITVLKSGSKVEVTGTVRGDWRYIAYRGDGGWVKEQYLVESKPKPAKTVKATAAAKAPSGSGGGISGAACSGGSSVESGLTSDAVRLHRALCAKFPGVTAYGGVRADSLPAHPSGRALDAMVSNTGLGQQVADWVRANAKQLGVSEVIFAQRIWTVQRGSEGWRSMSDRGSASANHYDHVHVTVYGNSGS